MKVIDRWIVMELLGLSLDIGIILERMIIMHYNSVRRVPLKDLSSHGVV